MYVPNLRARNGAERQFFMSARGSKSGFNKIGDVGVQRGETPLSPVRGGFTELLTEVSYGIDFLRSEHPAVQIAIVDSSWLGCDGNMGTGNARKAEDRVGEFLTRVRRPMETFEMTCDWYGEESQYAKPSASPKQRLGSVDQIIFTITRTVAPKTEEFNFGGMMTGDEFIDLEGNRNLVVTISGRAAAIPLEGISKHIPWWPSAIYLGHKIIK